jgi:hypothetical protein
MLRRFTVLFSFVFVGAAFAQSEVYDGPSLATLMLRTFFACVLMGLCMDTLAAIRDR